MKILIFFLIFFLMGCATSKDLKRIEKEFLQRDIEIIQILRGLTDAYNLHLQLLHQEPKIQTVYP